MNIKRRLRNCSGFSLAETLLATLILLLVSLLLANGIPTVKTVYENVTVGANARVLLSTTVGALRNELGTAKDIEVKGNEISYYSTDTHSISRIYMGTEGSVTAIMIQEYAYNLSDLLKNEGAGTTGSTDIKATDPRRLVTAVSATEGLYCTYDSVTTTADTITFDNLCVKRRKGEENLAVPVAPIDHLTIRVAFGPVKKVS